MEDLLVLVAPEYVWALAMLALLLIGVGFGVGLAAFLGVFKCREVAEEPRSYRVVLMAPGRAPSDTAPSLCVEVES